MQYLKFSQREWKVLTAAVDSIKVSEIAEKTGLPYTTVVSIINRLKNNVKITFIPDYRRMGLRPVSLIFRGFVRLEDMPPYTVAVRKLYGLKQYTLVTAFVPEKYTQIFIDSFSEEPIVTLLAEEVVHWTPKAKLTAFFPSLNVVVPKIDERVIYKLATEKYKKPEVKPVKLDKLDVLIIVWKMGYAFTKLSNIVREAAKRYPEFYNVSRQILDYHFERHVLPLWRLNSIKAYFNYTIVPFRIFFFEGREAPNLAKILVELPYFYTANICSNKAMVFAQPPCHMYRNIYEIFSMFDVDMPLGEFVMDHQNMLKRYTDLVEMFRIKEWVFPPIIKNSRWRS